MVSPPFFCPKISIVFLCNAVGVLFAPQLCHRRHHRLLLFALKTFSFLFWDGKVSSKKSQSQKNNLGRIVFENWKQKEELLPIYPLLRHGKKCIQRFRTFLDRYSFFYRFKTDGKRQRRISDFKQTLLILPVCTLPSVSPALYSSSHFRASSI